MDLFSFLPLPNHILRRGQKNEIFALAAKHGLTEFVHLFKFETIISSPVQLKQIGNEFDQDYFARNYVNMEQRYKISRLTFREFEYSINNVLRAFNEPQNFFDFHHYVTHQERFKGFAWGVKYKPYQTVGAARTDADLSWDNVINHVDEWMALLVEDNSPNFWNHPEIYRFAVNFQQPETDSAPFTEDERRLLRDGLARAKEDIRHSFDLSNQQMNYVSSRFDELSSKLDRLSRFDWKGLFISTVTSLAVDLAFDSEKRMILIGIIKGALMTAGTRLLN